MLLSLVYFYTFIYDQLPAHAANLNKYENDLRRWNSYKIQFNKEYASEVENQRRMEIYQNNAERVAKHNELFQKGQVSFNVTLNQFSDLTTEEFTKVYLSKISRSTPDQNLHTNFTFLPAVKNQSTPKKKNWVTEGAVPWVKSQGTCGSCWAFATVGVIESHAIIQYGKQVRLSEQNLLDCVGMRNGSCNSCDGGSVTLALEYVIENGGIAIEESYPYEEKENDDCYYYSEDKGVKIKSYRKVDAEQLENVVGNIGPVTCAIDASDWCFMHYHSGVYESENCSNLPGTEDHVLVIVGYGTDEQYDEDYWLVKNSWGLDWGEHGYIRMARNSDNVCGIKNENHYPVL